MKGLLILDIQNDFTGDKARMPVNKQQASQMILSLNKLLDHAATEKLEVIYIGNEFSPNDPFNLFRNFAAIKGRPGAAIDPRLKKVNENYFPKKKSNAFSNAELLRFLQEKNIRDIIITGLFAEACVWQTMKGALRHQFSVSAIADCIASSSDKRKARMLNRYQKKNIRLLSLNEKGQLIA